MSNIVVNIPGDRAKYPPSDHALLTLYALKDVGADEQNTKEHLKYSINTTGERMLQLFRSTGDIMFTKLVLEKDVTKISVQASVEDSGRTKDSTTIQVNILPKSPLDCDAITQDICYWHSATYKIFENTKPSIIGSLSSPYLAEMCRDFKLTYIILNNEGGNYFGVIPPTDINKLWEIRSLQPLDRDIVRHMEPFNRKSTESGEYRIVSLKCTVENPEGTIREVTKDIKVNILDQDDNLPVPQTKDINIYLPTNLIHKGEILEHKDLLFVDKDFPSSNKYDIKILGDSLSFLETNCNTYEDDRHNEVQTAIHCKFIFTKDMQIPESPYKVILQINDTALLSSRGNSVVQLPVNIYYHSRQTLPQSLDLTIPAQRRLLLYPSKEVEIFRTVAPLARVTQPRSDKLNTTIKLFKIASDSSNGAFAVTPNEGILFVHDNTLLRNASLVGVTIEWMDSKVYQTDKIEIKIVSEPNLTCNGRGQLPSEWDFCSNYKSKKACVKACGLSTGGFASVEKRKFSGLERCMWRGDQTPGNTITHLYATCTPDITTCPDGICDELEKLHRVICPQDCMETATLPLNLNRKTGRGFDLGFGVCYCTMSADCYCEIVENKKRGKDKPSTNTIGISASSNVTTITTERPTPTHNASIIVKANAGKHVGNDISKCGATCILGIAGSVLFLLVLVGGIVFCWRLERVHKAVREKFTNGTPDLSVPLSDYIDRGAQPDTFHFNFDVTSTLTSQLSRIEPDPKWEFPRNQLTVEQALGEGEFGRVLRARALNIAGQTGYTTVAVKTLKADAGERELADLLSEYQLLKEVSHPNVIRLLGASTQVGGPVYLIIEFAEHGSLRNYLRRSRHVHSETQTTINIQNFETSTNELYDEPKTCIITPKDILSFAWQIANGMSYLSDIKLVHRDLAARNILVATSKICKISDFGLTRDVYEDDAYFKRSKGRVPVKWMAPESLSDHIYTNKSDVWGFGILLWELVTLGASPYPGIVVQSLFHLLKTGYRMERPENCSTTLYKVMRSCWHANPEKRPTFSKLSAQIEKMLTDEVQYLDLTGNAINNRGYFCDNLEDEDEEDEEFTGSLNTASVNYLNKTRDYEKCGDTVKIATSEEGTSLLEPYPEGMQTSEGYETPIKLQNKTEDVTTPLNECPQYGYTDMSAGNKSGV